ncbi:helix-hairpin-helix domain-containing protein [Streptomyces gamaensis]|uniref:Helix-hairpin-helix domain-containing protein n=1 Tax=Streptomyces gamaensis TaxID=1763542 RepID=A0ABW0YVG6_9ACTN
MTDNRPTGEAPVEDRAPQDDPAASAPPPGPAEAGPAPGGDARPAPPQDARVPGEAPADGAPAAAQEPAGAPGADRDGVGAGPDSPRPEGDGAAPRDPVAQEPAGAPGADRDGVGAGPDSPRPEGGPRDPVAEALLAAVRAVESGERSADSFFNEPKAGARAARRPAAAAAPAAVRTAERAPAAPVAVTVPAAAARTAPRIDAEGLAGVRQTLAAGGAPEELAGSVAGALGEQAAALLREDPWQLLAVPGVRPEQADGFARALLGGQCGAGDERRVRALTVRLLERAALEGHTVREFPQLCAALAEHAVPDPEEALRGAVEEGAALVFQETVEPPGGPRGGADGGADGTGEAEETGAPVRLLLGLERWAMAEESLADGLARLANGLANGPAPGAGSAADWAAAAEGAPSPSAAELIRAAAGAGLVTHSGGEAARAEAVALVAAARSLGLRACAAVHAEDGRRRLAELGETEAVTVAGLLSGVEGPGRDADGALALDVLAVLDAPQLDVETAALLVESLADGSRLVLGGDPGVLGSAGPGRVFADVVAARICPAVVSRTPDEGPIGELVSGIGVGELDQAGTPGKEVVVVPVREAGEAVHRAVQLVADSVPRAIGVPAEHTQVITVGHGGPAGTRALNAALKQRLNPGPGRFAGFDPGDRVVYGPAPGRSLPGTVVSADAEGLRLDCGGTPVLVPRERVGATVRHGWAVTAHQAAGARWPAAVVVLPGDAGRTLTRSWVYTAFGRAERHLSVVHGAGTALPRAVAEVPAQERATRLRALLREHEAFTG